MLNYLRDNHMLKFLKKIFGRQPNYFISDAEKFLYEFNKSHPEKSASQLKEIEKYERIAYLRDHANKASNKNTVWDGF